MYTYNVIVMTLYTYVYRFTSNLNTLARVRRGAGGEQCLYHQLGFGDLFLVPHEAALLGVAVHCCSDMLKVPLEDEPLLLGRRLGFASSSLQFRPLVVPVRGVKVNTCAKV